MVNELVSRVIGLREDFHRIARVTDVRVVDGIAAKQRIVRAERVVHTPHDVVFVDDQGRLYVWTCVSIRPDRNLYRRSQRSFPGMLLVTVPMGGIGLHPLQRLYSAAICCDLRFAPGISSDQIPGCVLLAAVEGAQPACHRVPETPLARGGIARHHALHNVRLGNDRCSWSSQDSAGAPPSFRKRTACLS